MLGYSRFVTLQLSQILLCFFFFFVFFFNFISVSGGVSRPLGPISDACCLCCGQHIVLTLYNAFMLSFASDLTMITFWRETAKQNRQISDPGHNPDLNDNTHIITLGVCAQQPQLSCCTCSDSIAVIFLVNEVTFLVLHTTPAPPGPPPG